MSVVCTTWSIFDFSTTKFLRVPPSIDLPPMPFRPLPLFFFSFSLSLSPFNLLSSFRPFFPSLSLLSASPLASSSISLLFLFPRVSAGQPLLPLSLCRPESPTLLPSPSHSFVLATRQGFTADRTSTGRTRPLPRLISLIYYLSIVIQLRQLFDRSPTVRSPLVINL